MRERQARRRKDKQEGKKPTGRDLLSLRAAGGPEPEGTGQQIAEITNTVTESASEAQRPASIAGDENSARPGGVGETGLTAGLLDDVESEEFLRDSLSGNAVTEEEKLAML